MRFTITFGPHIHFCTARWAVLLFGIPLVVNFSLQFSVSMNTVRVPHWVPHYLLSCVAFGRTTAPRGHLCLSSECADQRTASEYIKFKPRARRTVRVINVFSGILGDTVVANKVNGFIYHTILKCNPNILIMLRLVPPQIQFEQPTESHISCFGSTTVSSGPSSTPYIWTRVFKQLIYTA